VTEGFDPVYDAEVHDPIWCDRCGCYHGGECEDESDG
jgi:hypothetical protein